MPQSKQEAHIYQEDEIDLRSLFNSLVARRFLIAGLTGFATVLAILYALNLAPTYQVSSSFTSPSEMSVTTINKLNLTSETKESVFSKFLIQLSSKELQKIAFVEGDFLTLFNPDNSSIDDVDAFISGAIGSVRINTPSMTKNDQDLGFLTELPYSVTMEGGSAETISEYLNTLVALANSKTIIELIKHDELKISNRLDEISLERDLLIEQAEKDRFSKIERIKEEDGQKIRQINDQIEALKIKAKRDRLNQIERIKEEDGQKIRQINDQIDRVRYKAKENRLNQIVVLIDSAKLAKSLGIIENNFKLINDDGAKSDLTIAIGESKDLPEWYLYGEKALIQRVELLENRMSDDPFIPELVTLNNQLNEVQNNNLLKTLETRQDDDPFIPEIVALQKTLKEVQLNNALKTLETRQDDSPFIAEIVKLDIEKIKLKSRIVSMNGVSSMQLSQTAIPPESPIKPNRRMIVLLAFIGSFMMSIFLALVMGALKPDEESSA
jgi:LPS O-antigen subunit length determinant protein (WzzB/FepE family)